MNTPWHSPSEVEKALGQQIQKLLRHIPWIQDINVSDNPAPFHRSFDWLVAFRVPKGPEVELWIDCRSEPRPAHFPYVSVDREFEEEGQTKRIRVRVFGAPHLSPRMREICEDHGWSWYDLAGNCRISVPGVIHLERTGNAPVHHPPRPAANLGTPEAGRVIRALIAPENADRPVWTQRAIQQETDPHVSLGLVNKVVQHLREEAFVEESPNGGIRLREPLKLLLAWRDAYRFDQQRRHGYFTLLKGRELRDSLARLGSQSGGFAQYAAFSAAEFQAPHVRQPKTWLYVREKEVPKFESLVEASAVATGENLVVLIPDDDGVFYMADGGLTSDHRMACTNAVQTYVDLWHAGGRGKEAAEALLERRLKPQWKDKGLKV